MTDRTAFFKTLLAALAVWALASCASTSSKLASPYVIEVQAADMVNVTEDGRAAPVQVTIYELGSRQAFDHADFFGVFERPREVLAQDLLHMEQFVLQPGQSKVIERPGGLEAKWVGVVVAFRDIDNASWREAVALPEPISTNIYKVWQFNPREETIRFTVDRSSVSLKDREKPFLPKIF